MPAPLCFVLMPFGEKAGPNGSVVDFDDVYDRLIAPAICESGLEPLRADKETTGGIIHKPMYERLIFCEYAVADLTTGNANVFYELGVRHAVRPYSTVDMRPCRSAVRSRGSAGLSVFAYARRWKCCERREPSISATISVLQN